MGSIGWLYAAASPQQLRRRRLFARICASLQSQAREREREPSAKKRRLFLASEHRLEVYEFYNKSNSFVFFPPEN